MPLGDRFCIGRVSEIPALLTEKDVIDRSLQARTRRTRALEGVANQFMQKSRERDMRIGTDRIAER